MCTGEMKYVILRIDTHVLRIDLCPRKRTRIRRQKQDEDVHLFLSERKKARPQLRQGPSLTPRRSWPRTRQTWQASLTPRKVSNKLFQGFRGLGKAQTSCFKVSDASERLKQVVSRFPTRRKGSNKLFQGIRGLGKAQTSCFKVSDASGRLRTPANLAGYPKGPECTYHGRGVLHTPPKRARGPEWMDAGYDHPPRTGSFGGAYAIRPYTGTRTNKPNGPPGPNDRNECTYRGGTFATDGGAR